MAASKTAADWAFTGPSSHSRACSRACRISGQLLDRGGLDISLERGLFRCSDREGSCVWKLLREFFKMGVLGEGGNLRRNGKMCAVKGSTEAKRVSGQVECGRDETVHKAKTRKSEYVFFFHFFFFFE